MLDQAALDRIDDYLDAMDEINAALFRSLDRDGEDDDDHEDFLQDFRAAHERNRAARAARRAARQALTAGRQAPTVPVTRLGDLTGTATIWSAGGTVPQTPVRSADRR